MTTRLKGALIVFEKDIREDDAVPILAAIRQIRGVLHVTNLELNHGDYIARVQVRSELHERLWDVLKQPQE